MFKFAEQDKFFRSNLNNLSAQKCCACKNNKIQELNIFKI